MFLLIVFYIDFVSLSLLGIVIQDIFLMINKNFMEVDFYPNKTDFNLFVNDKDCLNINMNVCKNLVDKKID